jgi:4-oxalomesaconate hydratase
MTLETVEVIRRAEVTQAGAVLGATMNFLEQGEYPLRNTDQILTHSRVDPYNYDHPLPPTSQCGRGWLPPHWAIPPSCASGRPTRLPLGASPARDELFRPDVLVDSTAVMDREAEAMSAMDLQEHLITYYRDLAKRRGVQAVRHGGSKGIAFAAAHQLVCPG